MRQGMFVRTFWSGVLGILFEIFLVVLFVGAGYVICFFWWKVIK